jgi:hypothetical protein
VEPLLLHFKISTNPVVDQSGKPVSNQFDMFKVGVDIILALATRRNDGGTDVIGGPPMLFWHGMEMVRCYYWELYHRI